MAKLKNIFIEGIQGTGKSTLLTKFSMQRPEYRAYREGDISPVELAWCSYMPEEEFGKTLEKFPDLQDEIKAKSVKEGDYYITAYTLILAEDRAFYEYMEAYEIYNGRVPFERFREVIMSRYAAFSGEGNVFECAFFQNSIESMLLFYEMDEEQIIEFYKEAFSILKDKAFKLVYLDSSNIHENLMQTRRERIDDQGNEMWYPLVMEYFKESPYGKRHGCKDMDDLVKYFHKRRELELRIIREVLGEYAIVLQARKYGEDRLYYMMEQ